MAASLPDAPAPVARAHALADIREALAPLGHEVEVLDSALDVRPWVDLRGLRAYCEELAAADLGRFIDCVGGWQSREDEAWKDIVLVFHAASPGCPSPMDGALAAYERTVVSRPDVLDGTLSIALTELRRGL